MALDSNDEPRFERTHGHSIGQKKTGTHTHLDDGDDDVVVNP